MPALGGKLVRESGVEDEGMSMMISGSGRRWAGKSSAALDALATGMLFLVTLADLRRLALILFVSTRDVCEFSSNDGSNTHRNQSKFS